jgi:transcriptional regulator with AAA-type ATPase domain
MIRLVAYAPDGVRRFPVLRAELLVGSDPACDIVLAYPGVGQQHARFTYDGHELRVVDLGSRKGVLVSGRRVRESTPLEVLDEVRLGGVTLLVEDVVAEPGEVEELPRRRATDTAPATPLSPELLIEHLSRISHWVLADAESRSTLESLVDGLLRDFGGGALFLFVGTLAEAGVKFVAASEVESLSAGEELLDAVRQRSAEATGATHLFFRGTLRGQPAWIFHRVFSALERPYFMIAALTRFDPEAWSPVPGLFALGDLLSLGLVHHVGRYEPILPGNRGTGELVLDPRLVVGESEVMKGVVERLRIALETGVHVLLRGEPGVGKELLARSIHLSSPRRGGPFIVASAAGANPTQLEAELFGSEVAGRGTPVRRQGKLVAADGGTLLLDHVDRLPLELQDRLVRFLRNGEVEPTGSREIQRADVRLIAASQHPLEPAVARDEFRVDLAYRLSRFAIDVPPLRERKGDLPLLIQSYVNRFCHETGKRVAGITTKAHAALLAYEYPGNLEELENVTRQMVYLCPHGQPVEPHFLPEAVRESPIQSLARIAPGSELDLERLVSACEQSAIREALRRVGGNKAQAARLLGLSRNGLAMKMARLGLKG